MTKTPVAAQLVVGVLLGGCYPLRGMRAVPVEQVSVSAPAHQAAVVFMRWTGGSISTAPFELHGPQDRFIGTPAAASRMVYVAPAGRTLLMPGGQSRRFLDAALVVGETYPV